jgi:hypothetical protein
LKIFSMHQLQEDMPTEITFRCDEKSAAGTNRSLQ